MRTVRVSNGWYCDALPSGEYVAQIKGGGLVSDRGDFRLMPPGVQQLLFLRLAQDGQRYAGVGQQDDLGWLWDGASWSSNGLAYGPNSVIFRADGTLLVEHDGSRTGSQGWRYVADDGTLVTGDSTYASKARDVYEYTTHGDVTIGQTSVAAEGCMALVAGQRVQLEKGWCRNIRFNRNADGSCSVALMKTTESVLMFFTRAELDSMQTFIRTTPPPTGTPMLKPPKVEVKQFTGLITPNNWRFVTTDANNPSLVIETWTEGGSIYQRITHSGGTARTQQFRKVV